MFAAVPIWTRTFGVEQYGLYSMCWVVTLVSSSFFTGWVRQAVLRHSGDSNYDVRGLPLWVVPVCAIASAFPVALIVLVESLNHVSADVVGLVASSVVFGVLNSLYIVAQTAAQRDDRVGRFTAAEFARIGGALGLSFVGADFFGRQGSVAIIGAYCIGSVFGLLILRGRREGVTVVRVRSGEVLERFWSFGWPMTLWLTISSMLLYADRLIIGVTLGASSVGTYGSMADIVVRGVGMVTFPLAMRSHPVLMRTWNSGDHLGALRLNRRYTAILAIVAIVCVVAGGVVGTTLIQKVLHVSVGNVLIVPALLGGAALWQVGLMTHKPLEMADRTRTMLLIIACITVASMGLNFVLIPRFGIVVPALVFLFGSASYVAITFRLSHVIESKLKASQGNLQAFRGGEVPFDVNIPPSG